MIRFTRSHLRILTPLLVLATALAATAAVAPTTALAGSEWCGEGQSLLRGEGECSNNTPDACPDQAGMQVNASECVAPTPAPAPAPAPAAAPAAPAPDEGYIAPPPAEFDHTDEALTLQTAQVDPAAVAGPEVTLGAADAATTAPGGGTTVASGGVPSGPLPYTGAVTTNLAILGIALLWAGAFGYLTAAIVRRRREAVAPS